MTNDISGVNLDEAVPCIALSKNDSYVMSACGGKVSLFNMMTFKVKSKLKGHQKRITGLVFSTNLNIKVSSGVDAQIFFVSCPSLYNASMMERLRQWVPQEVMPAPISYAAYSCNTPLIYFSPEALSGSQGVYPVVVVAHPLEPNQFALGLMDGYVKVIEPSEPEGKLGSSPYVDNGILNDSKSYQISNTLLTELMQRWDSDSAAFKVDNKSVRFVSNEMALILGLSTQGATVDILGRDSSRGSSPLCALRRLCGVDRINSAMTKPGNADFRIKGCTIALQVLDKLVSFSHEKEHDVVRQAYELEDVGHSGDGTVSPLADFSTPSQQ
ncbi:WD40/YVTN repeat-like-containing domain superfamily [Sesbania bispinosa]|nr:WD40/YVTN repeat-like-containing domain superfamily [Sesbania bispinosa]